MAALKTHFRAGLLGCTGLALAMAGPAHASIDEYSVEGGETAQIDLEVCSAESQLAVRGDSGTDLDFTLTDPAGNATHRDTGVDDYFSTVLAHDDGGCATWSLAVANLGEEANGFTVVLEPVIDASTRVHKYIIQASETRNLPFKACGTSAQVIARGDGDTDLDFVIRNADGAIVHEDESTSDETSATLAGLLADCETFDMEVTNLGEVYNALMVVVKPTGANAEPFAGTAPSTSLASAGPTQSGGGTVTVAETEGAGEYRVDGSSTLKVNLPVCGATRMEVRGDGDTDLDFTVTDEAGDTVHSDFDLSDVTFATLRPKGEEDDSCETFAIAVANVGEVHNVFSIALLDNGSRGGASGPGEYQIGAGAATKVALRVCEATRVLARGDGDTDLDFDVTDARGSNLHSDYDLTDRTDFMLKPEEGACEDYQMSVSNLGQVFNVLTVDFGADDGSFEAAASATASAVSGPSFGFAKGLGSDGEADRTITIMNRSGETLGSMFWSNSATFEWGDDMLDEEHTLPSGGNWEVDVADGSNACLFDFRAVTESGREVEVKAVNVCDIAAVTME